MDIAEAFRTVLDLAKQNVIDERDVPNEAARQNEAIAVIETLAIDQFGDEARPHAPS